MHIGLFSPALPSTGSANGIVTYVRFMQAALRDLGHRVTVISHQAVERPDGVIQQNQSRGNIGQKFRSITSRLGSSQDRRPGYNPDVTRLVRAVHRADPFDVFEMEESFGWVGELGLDVPVVARLHGPHFLGKDEIEPDDVARASAARITAEGKAIANVAGVTSPSARLMAATFAHYALDPHHALPLFNPIPSLPSGQCWSIDRCNPDQLLFVGRFDLRKGADVALSAFILAAKRNPRLRLVMCGPDPGILLPSGERVHFAQHLATQVPLAMSDRIEYLGEVGSAEIQRLRLESVLCLSTSRFEVFAYSMTEALAAGMPLIASHTFGMAELLRTGETGYIVPIGDAAAVAATIGEALADRTALSAIGAAGRSLCASALDPRKIALDTVAFYRSLSG